MIHTTIQSNKILQLDKKRFLNADYIQSAKFVLWEHGVPEQMSSLAHTSTLSLSEVKSFVHTHKQPVHTEVPKAEGSSKILGLCTLPTTYHRIHSIANVLSSSSSDGNSFHIMQSPSETIKSLRQSGQKLIFQCMFLKNKQTKKSAELTSAQSIQAPLNCPKLTAGL